MAELDELVREATALRKRALSLLGGERPAVLLLTIVSLLDEALLVLDRVDAKQAARSPAARRVAELRRLLNETRVHADCAAGIAVGRAVKTVRPRGRSAL